MTNDQTSMMKHLLIPAFILLVLGTPFFTLNAQAPPPKGATFESGFPGIAGQDIETFAKTAGLTGLVDLIIQVAIGIIVALGLIVIVISGFMYMAAEGDEGKITTAKSLLISAAYGITFAILSFVILNTISKQFADEVEEPTFQQKP